MKNHMDDGYSPARSESELCLGPTVVMWDRDHARRSLVERAIEGCAAKVLKIEVADDISGLACSFLQSVALVGLGAPASLETQSFPIIRALKLKGFRVVSFEHDALSWPIGIRCRALLNGCSTLLDSSKSSFFSDLLKVLTNALRVESEAYSEKQLIKQQMADFEIIGDSPQMTAVFGWVNRVSALSDFPVLISGETGTGKELIANTIYRLDGKRRKGPFIAANCGAISMSLAESELFGHRRGAFTGADTDRKGLFRAAEGGVLFLDEISELSPPLQAKFLRVLQERRVLGVGFDHDVPVDVRVIAATNRSLDQMIESGEFREDLYHRLNVLSITIPPLRERQEDLQPLVEHFLKKYSSLNRFGTSAVHSDFVHGLMQLQLTGNVRQLENLVRNALLHKVDDSPLGLADLSPSVWKDLSLDVPITQQLEEKVRLIAQTKRTVDDQSYFTRILDVNEWSLAKSLEYCERLLLKSALQLAKGNQTQTARLIGITPRSVYNKVHKLKIEY